MTQLTRRWQQPIGTSYEKGLKIITINTPDLKRPYQPEIKPKMKVEKQSSKFTFSPIFAKDKMIISTPINSTAPITTTPAPVKSLAAAAAVTSNADSISSSSFSTSAIYLTPGARNKDAENPFSEYSSVEGHMDFIQLLINAKAYADINQTCAPVCWKGYNTIIEPNLPPFTKDIIKKRLNTALETITAKQGNEVINC